MANTDRVHGFKPVKMLTGGPWNGRVNLYHVHAQNATIIGIGDLVVLTGTADNTTGVANVEQMAASEVPVGVVIGVQYENASNLERQHVAATTETYVLVADDPNIIMEVQEDAVTSTIAVAQVGQNFNIIVAAASTVTGLSGMEVDSESGDTVNTLPLRLHGFVRSPDNEFGATATANAKVLVSFNTHQYKAGTGTTGL